MKRSVKVTEAVMSRYEDRTRDEMVSMMDAALAAIPEGSRKEATFQIDTESFAYDDGEYPRLFIAYARPETEEEESRREGEEAASRALQEAREEAEFKRLSAKFAKK